MNNIIKTISIQKPVKIIGYYKIIDHGLCMTRKPNIFHRFFTKLFLGWKWIDIKQN